MNESYIYIQTERPDAETSGLWTVGFYNPAGRFVPESDHGNPETAADRVAWLNGAGNEPAKTVMKILSSDAAESLLESYIQKYLSYSGHSWAGIAGTFKALLHGALVYGYTETIIEHLEKYVKGATNERSV